MLGWPLNEPPQPILSVKEIPVFKDDKVVITRVLLEIFKNFRFYGIMYTHRGENPLPAAVSQHGGDGTPELCSSFFNSSNYNDMTLRLFHQGINVFAPQTLLWCKERYGPDIHRGEHDNTLKQLGGSIAALEIYCIQRVLDYLESREDCNGTLGMSGLSYGGFYTLYAAACDTRIKAALACSHFNDRVRYDWSDKVWNNAANTFLDAEVGALVCPRSLRIEVGSYDEIFSPETAKAEYLRLRKYYTEASDNLQFNIFKGGHEFCPEDSGVIWFADKLNSITK